MSSSLVRHGCTWRSSPPAMRSAADWRSPARTSPTAWPSRSTTSATTAVSNAGGEGGSSVSLPPTSDPSGLGVLLGLRAGAPDQAAPVRRPEDEDQGQSAEDHRPGGDRDLLAHRVGEDRDR